MIDALIAFVAGMIFGSLFGVCILALCLTSKEDEKMKIPIQFKSFDKNYNPYMFDDEHTYVVIIEEHWPGDEPSYHLDVAQSGGTYIDDFWDTENDWIEGEPDYWHVIAYAPLDDCWSKNPMEDDN